MAERPGTEPAFDGLRGPATIAAMGLDDGKMAVTS
jgi:hypothetical protein